ncbi:MAG: hypothetical protein LBE18_02705 [Planctomycetaceae bacterium]|jgi:hypothetical protein|nr:hypothetical protein [Planctomycetaceae bacterium]
MRSLFFYGLFFIFCVFVCTQDNIFCEERPSVWLSIIEGDDDNDRAAKKELGIETIAKENDYYKNMFGEKFRLKNTGYIFMNRAVTYYLVDPEKMYPFKNMRFAPYTELDKGYRGLHGRKNFYFSEKYRPDNELIPKKYFLGHATYLTDMLYWEWELSDIQFRVLESYHGMLLWIIPQGLDAKKGITKEACAEILLKTTQIPCKDTTELQNKFKLPSILREGDVFSNIKNFEKILTAKVISIKLASEFPMPREPNQWSNQLVGFISKDAICLIIVHGIPLRESYEFDNIIFDDCRWLSGRILEKNSKQPVLPQGVTKIPEYWKPALERNAEDEKLGLAMKEKERIEEATWRVWYDKNGKPLYNGVKMKFEHWTKQSGNFDHDIRFKDGVVMLEVRDDPNFHDQHFPLSEFSQADKKLIMSVPPLKYEYIINFTSTGMTDEHGNIIKFDTPKPVEPEPDDIE